VIGDPAQFLGLIVIILLALSIHEYAHAKFADMAGDPTPRIFGRVTLNPLSHLDPIGTMMIVLSSLAGFGIGWGKPVPMDPRRMNNPRWDHFVAVAAGPLSNLLQAVLWAFPARLLDGEFQQFASMGVSINVSLMIFNLIPLGPLDGHWLVGALLPEQARAKWYLFNRQAGGMLLLGILAIGWFTPINIIGGILGPIVMAITRALDGG
jgi:Zn-dependent protease